MSAAGILGYGAYAPRRRLSRQAVFDAVGWAAPALKAFAKGVRAFGDWDEDAVTMAVEAARACLKNAAAAPDALCFASTTAPFLDRQNAGIVAAALDLASDTHVFDAAGSQRAATSALVNAFQDDKRRTLIAAADRRPTKAGSSMEMLAGDAGAALLIGPGDPVADILGVQSVYADFVDHYRTATSETDYVLEERWFREEGLAKLAPQAVQPVLEKARIKIDKVAHLIAPLPNPALAGAVAKTLGADAARLSNPLFEECGHAGAAHPLLMLVDTLDKAAPGDLILLTAFGQGCDAVLVRKKRNLEGSNASIAISCYAVEENYAKFLSASGALDIDRGIRAERDNRTAQTVAYAKSRDVYGFVGGLCKACNTPQFPKARRCVNPECGALDQQADYRFADRAATVKSFTEDWLAFTREPPLIYGNIAFDGGGNVFMEMTGFKPGDLAVGAVVEMQFRIKDIDEQRGFHRYFWKAAPARGGGDG